MADRDDWIRETAYFLWLEEGCPEGQAERHWRDAETFVDAADLERKRVEGEPPGDLTDESLAVSGQRAAGGLRWRPTK